MTRKDCFDRQTLRAVAAGRCPKERLAAVRLSEGQRAGQDRAEQGDEKATRLLPYTSL